MGKDQKTQDRSRRRGAPSSTARRGKGSSSPLTKTPILREFSSGGVVFKKEKGKVLWLLAKTVPNVVFPKPIWRLPKGWIDDAGPGIPGPMASGEVRADKDSLQEAALREVSEESGVKAEIVKKITSISYVYTFPGRGRILKFVTFYLMKWEKDLLGGFDNETSEIAWLPFEEAVKTISLSGERGVLKKAKEILDSGTIDSLV